MTAFGRPMGCKRGAACWRCRNPEAARGRRETPVLAAVASRLSLRLLRGLQVGGVTALGGDGNLANRSGPLPVTNDGETGGDPTLVRVSVAH
jgi:hypothetical protein